MTREQEAFLAMALKVRNFNMKNSASMTAVPAVAQFYTQLNTLIQDMINADSGSRADLTGVTITKSRKRKTLETLALKLSNATASYALMNNDTTLQKKADFPTSIWGSCSEEALVSHCNTIKNLATPIGPNLGPYGATATDITALGTALSTFVDVASDPNVAVDQRADENKRLLSIIDQTRTLLTDKLDVLMRSFEVSSGSLYFRYQSARAIDINGHRTEPTATTDIAPNATVTAHRSAQYEATSYYTLQNTGKEAVIFSLSTTDGQEGPEPVLLDVGEKRSRLAENLAPSGTFLVVKNTSGNPAQVKIWVE